MASSNPERFLSAAGIDDALALERFLGYVFEPFEESTVLWNTVGGPEGVGNASYPSQVVASQIIESGSSHQFIMFADDVGSEFHTPGTELLGQAYTFDEGQITIDGILVQHRDVPLDQVQTSHFDAVAPIARGMGRQLGQDVDQMGFSIGVQAALGAARTKNGQTVHNGGNVVERVDGSGVTSAYPVSATGAKNFRDDVDHLAQLMDEDGIPRMGRYLLYTPYIRRVLQQDVKVFDTQVNGSTNADFARRVIGTMAGFDIIDADNNNLPSTNLTSSSIVSAGNLPSKYRYDFRYNGNDDGQPVALALCGAEEGKAGIGYLAAAHPLLGPIRTTMMVDERRNTMFLKAQMMIGWGQLYNPCAGAIIVDDA